MTAGGMGHSESLQALQGFRSAVAAKMAKTVRDHSVWQRVISFSDPALPSHAAIAPVLHRYAAQAARLHAHACIKISVEGVSIGDSQR